LVGYFIRPAASRVLGMPIARGSHLRAGPSFQADPSKTR